MFVSKAGNLYYYLKIDVADVEMDFVVKNYCYYVEGRAMTEKIIIQNTVKPDYKYTGI